MNRIIKFRAWNKEKRKMFLPYLVFNSRGSSPSSKYACQEQWEDGSTQGWLFEEVELMQFTGLLDKNGVEIYEGDVVDIHPVNPFRGAPTRRNIVTWINGGLFLKSIDGSILGHGELPSSHRIEVIGSIHEDPELLEVKP